MFCNIMFMFPIKKLVVCINFFNKIKIGDYFSCPTTELLVMNGVEKFDIISTHRNPKHYGHLHLCMTKFTCILQLRHNQSKPK